MTIDKMIRDWKKRAPKGWAKAGRRWDIKMIPDVSDLTFFILKQINWKNKTVDGLEIEREVFKLLAKVRRITQREK